MLGEPVPELDTKLKKPSLPLLLDVLAHRNVSFGAFINDKERVLAENDLMPINYFAKGLTISKAVGRVNIFDVSGNGLGSGTGFMIGNNILLTNNHVLATKADAVNSFIEFDFEMDENNRPKSSVLFGLDPNKLYITDEALDFTVVYVKQQSEAGGKNLSEYGYVPIIDTVGKIKEGDAVSIIQHPSGGRKSIALRNNKLLALFENFLQYQTDTQPGSSGSPVFNDKWELVGLHHSGVPKTDAQGRVLTKSGTVATANDDENDIAWIANEGVRISRIVAFLRQNASTVHKLLLKDIVGTSSDTPSNTGGSTTPTDTTAPTNNATIEQYYKNIDMNGANLFEAFSQLLASTHKNKLSYKPSQHLYPSVDKHSDGKLRSIYSGKSFTAEELRMMDEQIDVERKARFVELASREATMSTDALRTALDAIEAELPYNCEHVVPQSWFSKAQPMRGDLHHLFACEQRCNSFRSNTPYQDFADYKPKQVPVSDEVERPECGKSENGGFEPQFNQGVVARATLYFLMRYPDNISNRYDKTRLKTLLSWHKKFPVTDYEKSRNAKIHAAQGNRNPLIDFPKLAEKIDFEKGL